MENNIDHIIDKKIQEAMGDFEVPYQPSHWDKMADKMSQIEAQETQFDDSMRSRLTNVEKKFEPSHWAAMASQLDKLDVEDTSFDNTVRERVERMEAQYSSSHWEMMNKQLDQHFTLKGKIVRYKIIEVSLMLMALFTAFNVLESDRMSSEKGLEIPLIKTDQNIQPSKATEPKSFNSGYDWRKQKNNKDNKNSKKQQSNQPIVSTQTVDNQYVTNGNSENNLNNNTTNDLSKNPLQAVQNEMNVLNTEGVNALIATNQNKDIDSKDASNAVNTEGVASTIHPHDAVATLSTKSFNASNIASEMPLTNLDLNAITNNLNKANGVDVAEAVNVLRPKALSIVSMYDKLEMPAAKKNQWWRFGLFGTSSADIAETNYTVNDVLKGATNIADGNKGLGFSIGFKKGRIELESGFTYKHKEYVPAEVDVTTGGGIIDKPTFNYTKVVTPDLVKLNMISVPLNLNYHFIDSKRFNFYTSIGATTNFVTVLNAIYPPEIDVDQVKARLAETNAYLQSPDNKGFVKEVDIALYPKGMLDDFKFKENYYFTAQASLGLEYKMSPFASLFFQTGYEQHILQWGIGSRNDRISSFNLQAGAKMSFGKTKF
jgi:hypothetical protein